LKANPVTGAVELFRAAIGAADPGWQLTVLVSCCWVVVLLAIAAAVHRRFDRLFVDPL
jgi:ABC-type polysaccharide/polyol phosphate export permease